jgi:uncharacterized phiE125 gp8 family phage protein
VLEVLVPPAGEPVDASDGRLRAQVRLLTGENEEDDLLSGMAAAARDLVERHARLRLLTQTLRMTIPTLPAGRVPLPVGPVQSIAAVRVTGPGGTLEEVAPSVYELYRGAGSPAVRPRPGKAWPAMSSPGSAEIDFVVGFGASAAEVPEGLLQAIRLQTAHLYRHREGTGGAEVALGVQAMLSGWRVFV